MMKSMIAAASLAAAVQAVDTRGIKLFIESTTKTTFPGSMPATPDGLVKQVMDAIAAADAKYSSCAGQVTASKLAYWTDAEGKSATFMTTVDDTCGSQVALWGMEVGKALGQGLVLTSNSSGTTVYDDIQKCTVNGKVVCVGTAGATSCTAIQCASGAACTADTQCGTGSCKSGVCAAPKEATGGSGSAVQSTLLALGAAATVALAFF